MRLTLAALALVTGLATMGASAQAAPAAAQKSGVAAQTQLVKAKVTRKHHVARHKAHRKHVSNRKHVSSHGIGKVRKVAPKA